MKIPLCIPNIGEDELNLVREVLESGWLAHGAKNEQFEKEFANYVGVKNAVSLNSCTSALFLAIKALELEGEIIVPSFTFSASANAIVTAGCKPVFAEVEFDTCNLDPEDVRKKITDKTVAIMPVHFAGQSCKMDEIMEIAEMCGLRVIEDSAETLGGEFKGRKTGSFDIGCFSFFPTKNRTTGEGGMLTTNDDELAEKIRAMRGHGMMSSTWSREKEARPWFRASSLAGYNFRMCDILAAIGVVQLKKLDVMNEARRNHAQYLNKRLGGLEWLQTPTETEGMKHVYQMYTIKIDTQVVNRLSFVSRLKSAGIGANVHFDPPVHLQPYYTSMGWGVGDLPNTERLSNSIVTLPMYPQLRREELDYMVEKISE